MPEQNKQLYTGLDEIATLLIENEAWHAKAANECRKIGVRGWSEWHAVQSIMGKKCLDKLAECLMDKLKFSPQPNPMGLKMVNEFEMFNLDDFIEHHFEWVEREKYFNQALKEELIESKKIDRGLHEMLEKFQEESQEQATLVKRVYTNLRFAGFMEHHILVVSRWIEDYFKYEYKPGQKIDFVIG